MSTAKYPFKTILPGVGKRWSYIIEGRTDKGWVAIGDIKLYAPHLFKILGRDVDISHQAAMSSLRMDLLGACLNASERISKYDITWPHDASAWATENLHLISLRVKSPDTIVLTQDHPVVGSKIRKAPFWAQRIHQAVGYPTLLTDWEALEQNNLIPTAKRMQTLHSAHDVFKDKKSAECLTGETRILLIEKHREADPNMF